MATARGKLSPDERRARVEALLGLIEEVERRPDYPGVIGIAADLFPGYSIKNQALILGQRPDATSVAGFHAWKALGRKVKKGATGIAILVPMTRGQSKEIREADARAAADGLTGDKPKVFFGTGYVFDISDTEPIGEGETAEAPTMYAVKCDDCKRDLRRTTDVGESAQGGVCTSCTRDRERGSAFRTTRYAVIDARGFREIPAEEMPA